VRADLGGVDVSKLMHSGKLLAEIVRFAKANKLWWIVPLVLLLLLTGALVALGSSAAPFIYTLF